MPVKLCDVFLPTYSLAHGLAYLLNHLKVNLIFV